MDINTVVLIGDVQYIEGFITREDAMNKAILSIPRFSGIKDKITVISKEKIPKGKIRVCGEIRSRRNNKRLELYVCAQDIQPVNVAEYENEFVVEGVVCSGPYYKETKTKQLSQFLVCIEGCRNSYASVVVWNKVNYKQGDRIAISGRIQSRRFIKEGNAVEINELSAHTMPVLCQQNWQQSC